MTVQDIYSHIELLAPFNYQSAYDNSGLLVGDLGAKVTKICLCLDATTDVVKEAREKGADLIVAHHPVIFKAIKSISAKDPLCELIKSGINVICAHTNTDVAFMGDMMLTLLDLPKSYEAVEPILDNNEEVGFGKIVNLHEFIAPRELALKCKEAFKSPNVRFVDGGKFVSRVAVAPGSGGELLGIVASKGCHALVTGEVKHSFFVEAKNFGMTLIAAGHFHTENVFCSFLERRLQDYFPDVETFTAAKSIDICSYL